MDAITGYVTEVVVYPHRPGLVTVVMEDGQRVNLESTVDTLPDVVTFDGEPFNIPEVLTFLMLAPGRVKATLYPRLDRYGASTKAEFSSVLTERPKA